MASRSRRCPSSRTWRPGSRAPRPRTSKPRTRPPRPPTRSNASFAPSLRSSPMPDVETAVRALRCLDLTDLTDTCTDQAIDSLCARAVDPRGPVAAVCVWPQFVVRAREALRGSTVGIATVVNFPAGGEDVGRVTDDVQEALSDGANEIDLVLPYGAVRRGDLAIATEMVEAGREVTDHGRLLKVILETGELKEPDLIETASRLAVQAG